MKSGTLSKTAGILIIIIIIISFETNHFNIQSLACSEALIITWIEK